MSITKLIVYRSCEDTGLPPPPLQKKLRGSTQRFFFHRALIGRAFFSEHNDNFDYYFKIRIFARLEFFFLVSLKLKFRNLVFTIVSFVSLFPFEKKTPGV